MKGINKMVLSTLVASLVLGMTVSVFANDGTSMTTGANVPVGVGDAPIVKAKWEIEKGNSNLDDDTDKPWTQINPPLVKNGKVTVGYWMIVTDPNGFGDLTNKAYAEVTHPDGTPKYQVELTETYDECPEDASKITAAINALKAADAKGLVKFGTGYTLAEVIEELQQCSAKAYYGEADLDYHQMCGEFKWDYHCCKGTCEWHWEVIDNSHGYKVEGYAFDKYNVKSNFLTNYFEYICVPMIELDFDRANFGNVVVSSNKWIEGNVDWDSKITGDNPACAPGVETNCRAPTVRNIGNTPVKIKVNLTDMGFGKSTSGWNVAWDARLALNDAVYFSPYEDKELTGTLPLCNTTKISFSIHVIKATSTGPKSGTLTITPEAVPFPWWS